ncbi:unnamed protein product [Pylaiella littoralis]
MSPCSASVCCAFLLNASMRRLVLPSTNHGRVQPAAFIGTAVSSSSRSSSSCKNVGPRKTFGNGRHALARLALGSCFPSSTSLTTRSGGSSCRRLHQRQPQQQRRRAIHGRWALTPRSTAAMSTAATETGPGSDTPSAAAAGVTGATDSSAAGGMKVTLLSGFLGAGKTTLMQNVLRQAREERLSLFVIVNDMADVNIDAQLLGRGGQDERRKAGIAGVFEAAGADVRSVVSGNANDGLVAMQDGCICCTLRDDLLLEVEAIAREGKYQHLIIESTGISDPTPVAEALVSSEGSIESSTHSLADGSTGDDGESNGGVAILGRESEGGRQKQGFFSLDTLVTVVDSTSFLDEVRKADDLEERGLEAEEGDTRTIADLLVSQVEFANVILLNKADLATEADLATLEGLVRRLNPAARVVRTVSSAVDLAEVLGTGEFDLDEASQAAGWLQSLNEQEPVEHASHDDHQRHDNAGQPQDACGHEEACPSHDRGDDHHHNDCGHNHGHEDHDHGHNHDHAHGGDATPPSSREAETFGIGSFTFRSRRPFHPERLMGFVMDHLPSVLRSKGFLWLATRNDAAGVWNQAGGSFATEYGGLWDDELIDTDEIEEGGDGHGQEYRDQEGEEVNAAATTRAASYGQTDEDDSGNAGSSAVGRNELVFIGLGMDEDALKAELERCLLTEEEMVGGPPEWGRRFSDPFPPWE